MGRGSYLGGGTILSAGFGFTPLVDDVGYQPTPGKPTKNQTKAAARSKAKVARLKRAKALPKRPMPSAPKRPKRPADVMGNAVLRTV